MSFNWLEFIDKHHNNPALPLPCESKIGGAGSYVMGSFRSSFYSSFYSSFQSSFYSSFQGSYNSQLSIVNCQLPCQLANADLLNMFGYGIDLI